MLKLYTAADSLNNVHYDSFDIPQHIDSHDPYRLDPVQPQLRIALDVKLRLIASPMRFAINFNRQLRFGTEEIEHVEPGGVLLAKLESARA